MTLNFAIHHYQVITLSAILLQWSVSILQSSPSPFPNPLPHSAGRHLSSTNSSLTDFYVFWSNWGASFIFVDFSNMDYCRYSHWGGPHRSFPNATQKHCNTRTLSINTSLHCMSLLRLLSLTYTESTGDKSVVEHYWPAR